ncbi:CHSTF-like protein [Mya arenaria]|uniref:CHSTF-like protein n=1 Tax=Mya arenaria TaxID=6604 RepID=A0ABY7G0U8_MYAAR|nr:CHSTF-like protein [Mya arenaria]
MQQRSLTQSENILADKIHQIHRDEESEHGEQETSNMDFETYVTKFNKAAEIIQATSHISADGTLMNSVKITGEGSPSNLHLNSHWQRLPGNENLTEPRYVILDYIRHFIPDAKLIITFRDPIDRLYSDYYHEYGTLMKKKRPRARPVPRDSVSGCATVQRVLPGPNYSQLCL